MNSCGTKQGACCILSREQRCPASTRATAVAVGNDQARLNLLGRRPPRGFPETPEHTRRPRHTRHTQTTQGTLIPQHARQHESHQNSRHTRSTRARREWGLIARWQEVGRRASRHPYSLPLSSHSSPPSAHATSTFSPLTQLSGPIPSAPRTFSRESQRLDPTRPEPVPPVAPSGAKWQQEPSATPSRPRAQLRASDGISLFLQHSQTQLTPISPARTHTRPAISRPPPSTPLDPIRSPPPPPRRLPVHNSHATPRRHAQHRHRLLAPQPAPFALALGLSSL